MSKIKNFFKYSFLSVIVFCKLYILFVAAIIKKIVNFSTAKTKEAKAQNKMLEAVNKIESNLYGIGSVLEDMTVVLSDMTIMSSGDGGITEEEFEAWGNVMQSDNNPNCPAKKPKINYSNSLIFKNKKNNPDYNNEWEPFVGKNSNN